MKSIALIIALIISIEQYAQTPLNKTIPVKSGQQVNMHFDYPVVHLSTWDGNEISVQGVVSINSGENDDAFIFESSTSGNIINLTSRIKDIRNLPERVTIIRNGQKIIFKDKEEYRKYQSQYGKGFDTMFSGPDIDIKIEIKVPKNVQTHIESVYGIVEVTGFSGPLEVEATYGGVDAALTERSAGEIIAQTNYGEIFTNLDTKFGGDSHVNSDFHMHVSAKPGSGPRYSFESKYGNVYIRKAN